MTRAMAVFQTLLLCALVATAAPAPKEKGDYYLPTREGDKRVYEENGIGDRVRQSADVVTNVEKKGEALIVTIGREIKGKMRAIGTYEVSDKGVTAIVSGPARLKTPHPVLRLPAKAGDQWTYESDGGDGPIGAKSTYTVGREEEVEVPAGKFKAIRVDAELKYPGPGGETTIKSIRWYAPRVGLVKSVMNPGVKQTTMVLKSFTPGK